MNGHEGSAQLAEVLRWQFTSCPFVSLFPSTVVPFVDVSRETADADVEAKQNGCQGSYSVCVLQTSRTCN